jgi:hypothetical protein
MHEQRVIKPAKEDWINKKWRPAMGWMYMAVCITDFVIFPILWSLLQLYGQGEVRSQWNPITLSGAGLFHMAMGAVLGIAAWSRGQEKMTMSQTNSSYAPGPSYQPQQFPPTQRDMQIEIEREQMSQTPMDVPRVGPKPNVRRP